MFTFELICMLLEGYLNNFTLSGFFWGWIFSAHSACVGKLLAQAQPAKTSFFSAGSACVGKLLAQAQCVRKFIPCFFSAHSACAGNFLAQAHPA
jgi:hypothetical protein